MDIESNVLVKGIFLGQDESPLGATKHMVIFPKIVSEYDQKITQSQTADNPMAPPGRAAQPSRDTRKTN